MDFEQTLCEVLKIWLDEEGFEYTDVKEPATPRNVQVEITRNFQIECDGYTLQIWFKEGDIVLSYLVKTDECPKGISFKIHGREIPLEHPNCFDILKARIAESPKFCRLAKNMIHNRVFTNGLWTKQD